MFIELLLTPVSVAALQFSELALLGIAAVRIAITCSLFSALQLLG